MRSLFFVAAILSAIFNVGFTTKQTDERFRTTDTKGLIEVAINATLNKVLGSLPDTIAINSLPVNFGDSSILSGALNVTNLRINGIKELVATEIHLELLSEDLTLAFRIPEISVQFKYWLDMELLEIVPFYGEGRISVVLEGLEMAVDCHAHILGGISVSNVTASLGMNDATFNLNGLINNPEFSALVSTALNDNFVSFIQNHSTFVTRLLSPIVEAVLNLIL